MRAFALDEFAFSLDDSRFCVAVGDGAGSRLPCSCCHDVHRQRYSLSAGAAEWCRSKPYSSFSSQRPTASLQEGITLSVTSIAKNQLIMTYILAATHRCRAPWHGDKAVKTAAKIYYLFERKLINKRITTKKLAMRVAASRGPTRAQWTARVNEGVNDVRHSMFKYAEAGVTQACMTRPGLRRLTPKQRAEFRSALHDIDPLYCC
jgi:hypothetical protein